MEKVYEKGRTRKHVNPKRILYGIRQGRTRKKIKNKRKEAAKLRQARREEKRREEKRREEKRREDNFFSRGRRF